MQRFKQKEGLCLIPVEEIVPATHQPRTFFKDQALRELAESIKTHGILQPLLILRAEEGYRLIAGERRQRAAKLAGLSKVPCILTERSEEEAAKLSLIENLQREDLSFFEEAAAFRRLQEEFQMSQATIAREMNKDPSTIANKLRLLKLPISAQLLIRQNDLTERHARALLKVQDQELLMTLLEEIIARGCNVAETEQLIAKAIAPKEKQARPRRVCSLKDVRLCINTLNHTVATLRNAGIKPQTQILDEERFVEYIIRIPKTS